MEIFSLSKEKILFSCTSSTVLCRIPINKNNINIKKHGLSVN